jgi:hypothetical protein
MIVIVRNRTTGATETFLNVERIESNSKDDGASAFTISLTDRTKHYYPAHLYSYEAVDRLSRGCHAGKTEEWKKLRESILGSTENKQEPFFNGYIPNFYFKPKGENK